MLARLSPASAVESELDEPSDDPWLRLPRRERLDGDFGAGMLYLPWVVLASEAIRTGSRVGPPALSPAGRVGPPALSPAGRVGPPALSPAGTRAAPSARAGGSRPGP